MSIFDFPLWQPHESNWLIWKNKSGYIYKTAYKATTENDYLFLLYLLLKKQLMSEEKRLTLTRYQILKDCGFNRDQRNYQMLENSLDRWKHVHVDHNNSKFGIIDAWGINPDNKKIWLRFSQEWLLSIGDTKELKKDFDQLKKLRSPLAVLLYETLSDQLKIEDSWKIYVQDIAIQLGMKEKYASHITNKIQSVLKKINERTGLNYQVDVCLKDNGKPLLIFTKDHTKKASKSNRIKKPKGMDKEIDTEAQKILDSLDENQQKKIRKQAELRLQKLIDQKGHALKPDDPEMELPIQRYMLDIIKKTYHIDTPLLKKYNKQIT